MKLRVDAHIRRRASGLDQDLLLADMARDVKDLLDALIAEKRAHAHTRQLWLDPDEVEVIILRAEADALEKLR